MKSSLRMLRGPIEKQISMFRSAKLNKAGYCVPFRVFVSMEDFGNMYPQVSVRDGGSR